jgi:hypothetical protein
VDKNKKLREEFVQLLHEYRVKHVNESNLELRELYSPQLLYNYLRKHHWDKGIPQKFLEDWIQMKQTKHQLGEKEHLDFEEILVDLKIPQENIATLLSTYKKDPFTTTHEEEPTVPVQTTDEKTPKAENSKTRPSVSEFSSFEQWILAQLDELELFINTKAHNNTNIDQSGGVSYSVILDGSNIARNKNNSQKASISDVIKCRERLHQLGVSKKEILIVFGAGLHHSVSSQEKGLYELLLAEENVSQAPAERDDDWFMIQYALTHNSYIITNDRFLEYRKKCPQYESFLTSHFIRYSIIGNEVIFEEEFQEKVEKLKG